MKYIKIYLNKRQEEIEKFKEAYSNCIDDKDVESLLEDVFCGYYVMVDSYNMSLKEIENLRNDLIPKDDLGE